MKRLYLLALVAAVACQSSDKEAPITAVDAAYKADIEALCDVVNRSGTAGMDVNDRTMKIATWLGSNLQTKDARQFLAKIRPIKGPAKGDAIDAEAKRLGIAACPLAAEWRAVPAKT
jgi:hypothetical protein